MSFLFKLKKVKIQEQIEVKDGVLEIREAKQRDVKRFVEIEKSVYNGSAPWSAFAFKYELFNKNGGKYLTGVFNNRVVAFIGSNQLIGSELHLTNFAVDKNYQKKEIGSNMLQAQIEFARNTGVKKISLEVRKSNIFAQKIYHRFGFEVIGEKPKYYNDDHEDAIAMEKVLIAN